MPTVAFRAWENAWNFTLEYTFKHPCAYTLRWGCHFPYCFLIFLHVMDNSKGGAERHKRGWEHPKLLGEEKEGEITAEVSKTYKRPEDDRPYYAPPIIKMFLLGE